MKLTDDEMLIYKKELKDEKDQFNFAVNPNLFHKA